MKENFAEVSVDVVECPDLTQAPFHLAANGLSGSPTIADIGGLSYALPTVDRSKVYDIVQIGHRILPNSDEFIAVGAGSAPYTDSTAEVNELIFCFCS